MKVKGDPWTVLRQVEPPLYAIVDYFPRAGWLVELHHVGRKARIPEVVGEGRTVDIALRRALEGLDLELLRLHA